MKIRRIFNIFVLLLLVSCSATRYVSQGNYLLRGNKVEIQADNNKQTRQISKSEIESYIQQRPNRRFLGVGLYLGFYNITDSSKHDWWHRFWGTKLGEAPVVLDSSLVQKSKREIEIYLDANGMLDSEVSDTIIVNKRRKATVKYTVKLNEPFMIRSIRYNISDTYIRPLVLADTINSKLIVGELFQRKSFEDERLRITNRLRDMGFWGFNTSYINYTVDTIDNMVNVQLNLRRLRGAQNQDGQYSYSNHPIYRIEKVAINTDYDPSLSPQQAQMVKMDTTYYKGVEIYYKEKLHIKADIISNALGLSSGVLYDQQNVERAYNSVRSLGYNSNVLFTPIETRDTVWVDHPDSLAQDARTAELPLLCYVQCTPNLRQNFSQGFELSTTSDFYAMSLTLSYQNRNLFRGAEDFNVSFRGSYEFTKQATARNSFEFGASTSLALPRFLLPISPEKMRRFKYSSTKLTVSYNIQNRPFYRRSLVSAVYGYSWIMKNGARFTINPADINVVNVPWVDKKFIDSIANPYLANSYNSQLIAGASASYFYNTNADIKQNGFTFRVTGDVNGNLLRLISQITDRPVLRDGETYYNIFGLRYAQYARLSAEVSNRVNIGQRSQLAWRLMLAAGYAYGNSSTIPFERLFFAGGSNSMRGWQVRTLGPGSALIKNLGPYPNQLGDMRLEANLEYRVNVAGAFNMAFFMDCGNIWMNGRGETRPEAKFKIDNFYKQLALNTGIGIRYDLGYFLIRLDWGIKLHNPNEPMGQRWFRQMKIDDTALHFALGLPF